MNRLFSELFREFSGVTLEVCEAILGVILKVFWQEFEGQHTRTTIQELKNNYTRLIFTFSLLSSNQSIHRVGWKQPLNHFNT